MKARVIKKRGDILNGYFLVLEGQVEKGDYVRNPVYQGRGIKKWGRWQLATALIKTQIETLDWQVIRKIK